MHFFYNIVLILLQPILCLNLLYKKLTKHNCTHEFSERYAYYPTASKQKIQQNGILLHVASVGEAIAALPLIYELKQKYPSLFITVTTQTTTGKRRLLQEPLIDLVFYLPYDLPWIMRRLLTTIQAKILIILETELWPNLIDQAHKQQIPIILANARLSARSLSRYKYIQSFVNQIVAKITLIAAQDQFNADNYLKLSQTTDKIKITGNLKYIVPTIKQFDPQITTYQQQLSTKNVWIAASTHQGEDQIILAAHQQLLEKYPDLFLILVPRHPERFNFVNTLLQASNLHYLKFSEQKNIEVTDQVLLVDSMGKLRQLYTISNIAFIGGSMVNIGGHNPIEAAICHMPIIVGHHLANFKEIYQQLRAGVIEIDSEVTALVNAISNLLDDQQLCTTLAENNYLAIQNGQQALTNLMSYLDIFLQTDQLTNVNRV